MLQKEFDQILLATILVHSIKTGFSNEPYSDENKHDYSTKQSIIQLANQILSKDILDMYPEFEIKKPDLFSKLNDATTEAKSTLEAKHDVLHQICLKVMEEFPILQAVKIESVEYGIIKVTHSNKQVENSTYIAINDEEQLKQNVQKFLDKIKIKEENSK